MSDFHVEVKTADEAGAGTDSNIFLVLFGEFGQSEERRLNGRISGNVFERNRTDKFDLSGLPNLGYIYKIHVRSDTHYLGSDWNLNWIRVTSHNPDRPSSTFSFNGWINDTSVHEKYADDWLQWRESSSLGESTIVKSVSCMNLLDAPQPLEQEFTVTYKVEHQVEISTDVTDESKLSTKVSWTSPEKIFGINLGKFSAEVAADWTENIKNHQLQKDTVSLQTDDKRKLTFPAGKLTMIEADWTELWKKATVSLGSTTIGMRWLDAIPTNPSWTVKSFAKGDFVPEPFASYIRQHMPDLEQVFNLQPPLPASGGYYEIISKNSGKCLEIAGEAKAMDNGAVAEQGEWRNLKNQRWIFTNIENNVYEITNLQSIKCLDVREGSKDNGATVQQWDGLVGWP